jgi:hypothetical protein
LGYSTYLGGSASDDAKGIAVDAAGNAYVTGDTESVNFPLQNPFHGQLGGSDDAFVTKLNAAGTALVYSTYLGGTSTFVDEGFSIAADGAGNAYVTGLTGSDDFPVGPGFQTTYGGQGDAFVSKLSPTGNALAYSSYLGGKFADNALGIAVDKAGSAYVSGVTASPDFPTASPFQNSLAGSSDAFVTKVSAAGTTKVYSTYLGGAQSDRGMSIAVDAAGRAYVTGQTGSADYPLLNPFQGSYGGGALDAMVTEFSAAGSTLVYSTYLGGSGQDQGFGIAVGAAGDANVTGVTLSSNFPTTPGAFDTTSNGQQDAFVTRLNAAGNTVAFSTYLGGSGLDFGNAIDVNGSGNVYVAGNTKSTNFPTKAPLQGSGGGTFDDAFMTELIPDGAALVHSTYLGGSFPDVATAIAVDAAGNAYLAGETSSTNFPTKNPFQSAPGGSNDAFVTRILPGNPTSLPTDHWTAEGPAPISNGQVPGFGAVSGRIAAIAPHPTDPNTIYVASAGGGVWKTGNAGNSWTPLSDQQDTLVTGAIAVAPSSPTTLYAGTGEACNSPDNCYYGRGVLKSRNAGGAWKLYPGNPSQNEFDRRTIAKLAVDPANANVLYAAVAPGGTNGLPGNAGIWKSTNGGRTWANTTAFISTTDDFNDVALDPSNPQTLYAAVGTVGGSAVNGVYKSTDGGASWNPLGGGLPAGTTAGKTRVAVAPSQPQTLYASVMGTGQPGSAALGKLFKMMTSPDGGTTWTDLTATTPDYTDDIGWYASALAVDPANPNVVYAGSEAIIQTTNGGATWKDIEAGANGNGVHADHQAFAFDANGKLLDGNDGGIWRLDKCRCASWRSTWTTTSWPPARSAAACGRSASGRPARRRHRHPGVTRASVRWNLGPGLRLLWCALGTRRCR